MPEANAVGEMGDRRVRSAGVVHARCVDDNGPLSTSGKLIVAIKIGVQLCWSFTNIVSNKFGVCFYLCKTGYFYRKLERHFVWWSIHFT